MLTGAGSSTHTCSSNPEASCDVSRPDATNPEAFEVAFWSCLTPQVDSITPNEGTSQTTITIDGSGFGSEAGCVTVEVGGETCTVLSHDETTVTCNLADVVSLSVFVAHPVELFLGNKGLAWTNINDVPARSFVLKPYIEEIAPATGSMVGGTDLVINGGGFYDETDNDDILVTVGGYPCPVISSDFNSITCKTGSYNQDETVDVVVSVKARDAECSNPCTFHYTSSATPLLQGVSPVDVTGNIEITITGDGFGTDMTKVFVTASDEVCAVTQVTDTTITCDIPSLAVGGHDLKVHVSGKGDADGQVSINSQLIVTAISPSEGSTEGGTSVTVDGSGFKPTDNTVTIGDVICSVDSVTTSQIVCTTGPRTSGEVTVTVTSDGVSDNSQTYTYSTALTPGVTSISPQSGARGDTLTISGSVFSSAPNDNIVKIGEAECNVTASTSSSITCTIGAHAAGSYDVEVVVTNKGSATSSETFQYILEATSISPTTGRHSIITYTWS